jgi:hypothetical protein
MSGLSVLLLGIGLGLRHAADADHVVVVSALVQREPGVWRAARIAALWGAGHTVAFLALGLAIVLAGVRVPEAFEAGAEVLVALMLIGLGAWHLARTRVARDAEVSTRSAAARPLVMGLVHGLAGSAGIALLAATTIASRPLAVAYLALVALGTVLGMVALTLVISRPLGWAMRLEGKLGRPLSLLPALLSVTLGVVVLARALLGEGAA